MSGTMLDEGSLSEKGVELPRFIGDDYMVMRGHRKSAHRLHITDRDMNILQGLFPMDTTLNEMDRFSLTQQVCVGFDGGGALVNLAAQDTLYRVTGRGMIPEAILKKGRYRRPEEFFAIDPAEIDPAAPRYMMSSTVKSPGSGYYFIDYLLDSGRAVQVWSRERGLVSHSDNRDGFDKFGFRFVFPSGVETRVSSFHFDGDTVAFVVDAVNAVGAVESLREDDNPVIVIATLK
jgi:hypothetical protein